MECGQADRLAYMETIQSRLVWAREQAKMSQAAVAKKAKMSQPTYSELERGLSKSSAKLVQIAAALNVSPVWLATGKGDPSRLTEVKAHPGLTGEQNLLLAAIDGLQAEEIVELINKAYEMKRARDAPQEKNKAKDGR